MLEKMASGLHTQTLSHQSIAIGVNVVSEESQEITGQPQNEPQQIAYQLLETPRHCAGVLGYQWIRDGFRYFAKAPLIWIVMTIIFLAIMVLIGVVPVVSLLSPVLGPIFMGGLMLGCRAIDTGQPLRVAHLFAGFNRNTGSLAAVGGLYLLGYLAIIVVAMLIMLLSGGGDMFAAMSVETTNDIPTDVSGSMLMVSGGVMLLVVMLLYIPLIMLIWFAPALVVFHNVRPIAAMRLSFKACLRNWVPYLLYGLIALLLMIIAIVPIGLGLLIVMPALIASIYLSYRDIFESVEPPA